MIHPIFQIETDYCTPLLREALNNTEQLARYQRAEFITPEHLLLGFIFQKEFMRFCSAYAVETSNLINDLSDYLSTLDTIPADETYSCIMSSQMSQLMFDSNRIAEAAIEAQNALSDGTDSVYSTVVLDVPDVFDNFFLLEDSVARFLLEKYVETKDVEHDYLYELYEQGDNFDESRYNQMLLQNNEQFREAFEKFASDPAVKQKAQQALNALHALTQATQSASQQVLQEATQEELRGGQYDEQQAVHTAREPWENLVTCISDIWYQKNLLVGREKELSRAIRILCRRDKNNPLFIGEPGVGKTALIYGLAGLIAQGKVPAWLLGQTIYQLDVASMVAGANYHGDFEKRMKMVLEGASKRGDCIIYIDEIHTIAGNDSGNSTMSMADMLKPYLEDGSVRFIGSTTYQDFNKHMANNKALVRRFGQIDIKEPSVAETINIVTALLHSYEHHHGVKYDADAVRYAVEQSDALIHDRFLPDKALDIIDEAGAYLQQHPLRNKRGRPLAARYQKVDTAIIRNILTDVCRIDAKLLTSESNDGLKDLDQRISTHIYGQDEAVRQVVRAVMMSKAGLTEADKPLASLLFVGPTGVGKTEVCRVLARELGIELVRFDMSEYTEKHTISKLIGSPAGYVGYDDGGLLTDAVRKTPNCVILLDEIEKAHSDIYNILLQVMDYARLTDSKGNKADFRNVILIMTSNAGAQFATQAGIGFAGGQTKGEAMLQTVRKTFKPEFLNRLSATVVFNEMDRTMAALILDKKLRQLSERLEAKAVTMTLTPEAREFLLQKGFSAQYGAREMDRTLQQYLTPLFMDAILFGCLKNGGSATVNINDSGEALRLE